MHADPCHRAQYATLSALDRALLRLDTALRAAGTAGDAVDRRYLADSELFRHALASMRLQLAEGLAAARTMPADAWRDPDLVPVIEPVWWIEPGGGEDGLGVRDGVLHDADSGAPLLAARQRMLAQYRGTPMGEMVRRNGVVTYRVARRPTGKGAPSRETPAASSGEKPPVTPTPSAPAPGPTSGG
jgi:hypothetical protein